MKVEGLLFSPRTRGRKNRSSLGDNRAGKGRKTGPETSCPWYQSLPSQNDATWTWGCGRGAAFVVSLGWPLASLHASNRVEGPHSPLGHPRALLPPFPSQSYATRPLPPPPCLLCQCFCAAPQLRCGKNPQWPPGRYTEQAPGYRRNLPPRNVPCSNHFFKLHKHSLCTVINYLAENDASC